MVRFDIKIIPPLTKNIKQQHQQIFNDSDMKYCAVFFAAIIGSVLADELKLDPCQGNYKYQVTKAHTHSKLILGTPFKATLEGDFDEDINGGKFVVSKWLGSTRFPDDPFKTCEIAEGGCPIKCKETKAVTATLPLPSNLPPMVTFRVVGVAYGEDNAPLLCINTTVKYEKPSGF